MTSPVRPSVLTVIPFELLRVAAGNTVTLSTLDGQEIQLRLPTADELLEQAHQAGERLAADGLPPGPGMTHEQAASLVHPVDVGLAAQTLRAARFEVEELHRTIARLRRQQAELQDLTNRLTADLDRRNTTIQRIQAALRDA